MFWSDRSRRLMLERDAAAAPLTGPVLDFGASYDRALEDQRVRLNSDSRQKGLTEAYDDYADEIWRGSGQRLTNPYRIPDEIAAAHQGEGYLTWWQSRLDQFHAQAAELSAKHGLPAKSPTDLSAAMANRVRQVKDAADAQGVEMGWSGLGRFLGYAQGALEDPANAVSMLFGAPGPTTALTSAAAKATIASRLAPVGATMGREAVINAGTEAFTQPQVRAFNQDAGVEYGWGEVAGNVAMAGAAGAALAGAGHGLGLTAKALLDKWQGAKKAGALAEDADTRAAERVLRTEAETDALNPYPPGAAHEAIFADNLAQALRSLREGKPIPAELESRFRDHRAAALTDLASRAIDKDADNAELVVYGVLGAQQVEEIGPRVLALMPPASTLDHAVRRMDLGNLRHAFNRHGSDAIPFRPADAAHVADVVERGELVEIASNIHRRNLPYVERRLLVDGNWLHVGETVVGTKRPTLTFQTAFWNPGPKNNGAGGPKGGDRPVAPVSPAAIPGDQPGPTAYVRNDGDSPAVANMRAATPERKTLPPELRGPGGARPETLAVWLRRAGGITDPDGWLSHMGIDGKRLPGLINDKAGLDLDSAALRAWEEGFFPEYGDRPDLDHLRLALADELGPEGIGKVRQQDESLRADWNAYDGMMARLDRMGVDPYGMDWPDIQTAMRAADLAERAEDDVWKEAFSAIDPQGREALDHEQALIARVNGELMEADVAITTTLTDDGKMVLVSAREAMDLADDEAFGWQTAAACMGKVA